MIHTGWKGGQEEEGRGWNQKRCQQKDEEECKDKKWRGRGRRSRRKERI
jgi:hypothetical protein